MASEPWFCRLLCDCGNSSTGDLDTVDDKCDKCGGKMALINKWKASEY